MVVPPPTVWLGRVGGCLNFPRWVLLLGVDLDHFTSSGRRDLRTLPWLLGGLLHPDILFLGWPSIFGKAFGPTLTTQTSTASGCGDPPPHTVWLGWVAGLGCMVDWQVDYVFLMGVGCLSYGDPIDLPQV